MNYRACASGAAIQSHSRIHLEFGLNTALMLGLASPQSGVLVSV